MGENLRIVLEIDEKENENGNTTLDDDRLFLKKFHGYSKICIQCHDNPDADALASGYALYRYFESCKKQAEFIYTGHNQITKPNLVMMVKELGIPVKYVKELPECDILITADCQYGAGNVTKFEAKAVAMIDHHQCGIIQNENYYIRSSLGSCSTVVWDLLRAAGFDIDADINLSTALYYGLYSDTNQFEEIYHPLDKDMRDSLNINEPLLFRLMNTNLSLKELDIASTALTKQVYCKENKFSVIEASQCDPNILGIISDFVIQVEEVNTCVAFNPNPGGYKLSARSCIKEVKANELAEYLCEGIGNGGGHLAKAGGFIADNLFNKKYNNMSMKDYLIKKINKYHNDFEVIYAKTYNIDMQELSKYQKKDVVIGVAAASDFIKEGTPVLVRTLEGDVNLKVEEGLYFMIGIEGEVYPIRKEKFDRTYKYIDGTPDMIMEYAPTVRDNICGNVYQLMEYMKTCVATGKSMVYAKELETNIKVFTSWDETKYYCGMKGDFLVVREDDPHDIYVVRRDIFFKTYKEVF
ncbi:MAG: DHH family phosphoesterase [Lachnospiraceae bacterium]|nr:DHH family phosphoesterase [Lachnospiraceae bacterium]